MTTRSPKEVALQFFNALHHKNEEELMRCFKSGMPFEDVLPNGTLVTSVEELSKLHMHFFKDEKTGFLPFDKNRAFPGKDDKSTHRDFKEEDLEVVVMFDNGGFFRIAAEVDRPADFRVKGSKILRLYMYLGVLIKDGSVCHVQNTLFDPTLTDAF